MNNECGYCHGIRLVGWSGAGPLLCPECSHGKDAFTVVTQAWREQRASVKTLQATLTEAVRLLHMLDNQEARHPDVAAFLDQYEGDQ